MKQIKLKDKIKTDKKLVKEAETLTGELIDQNDYVSAPQTNLPAICNGLDLPSEVRGPWSHTDKQRWIVATENLLTRGVKSGRELSRLTGLNAVAANNFIKEVKEGWSQNLTVSRVNVERERLYAENERIAEFAWNLISVDPTDNKVPSLLKIIGESNTRRSRLVGAEQINLQVTANVDDRHQTIEETQRTAAARLGVKVEALEDLGDSIADILLPYEFEDEDESED